MASTPFLPPAFWASGTNQNSIPANNNALRLLISQANVNNATTAQPSLTSPADDGKCYIIQSTHTGAQWSTFTPKDVAVFYGGTWYAFAPVEGMKVSVSGAIYIYNSGAWGAAGGGALTNPMTTAGDIIAGGASGTPARLAIGTNTSDVLGVAAGTPAWVKRTPLIIPIACGDETTAIVAGTSKVTFRMPCAMTLTAVRASLTTAQATGANLVTVDVNESGTTILSTKLTFDNTEKTTTTAATAPVISDANLADDAEITVDVDLVQSGSVAAGLKVYLIGYPA